MSVSKSFGFRTRLSCQVDNVFDSGLTRVGIVDIKGNLNIFPVGYKRI